MEKSDFYNRLTIYLKESSRSHDPEIMANAIYFKLKQHKASMETKRSYDDFLKRVKRILRKRYGWKMAEIHACFLILHRLTKYIEKPT